MKGHVALLPPRIEDATSGTNVFYSRVQRPSSSRTARASPSRPVSFDLPLHVRMAVSIFGSIDKAAVYLTAAWLPSVVIETICTSTVCVVHGHVELAGGERASVEILELPTRLSCGASLQERRAFEHRITLYT